MLLFCTIYTIWTVFFIFVYIQWRFSRCSLRLTSGDIRRNFKPNPIHKDRLFWFHVTYVFSIPQFQSFPFRNSTLKILVHLCCDQEMISQLLVKSPNYFNESFYPLGHEFWGIINLQTIWVLVKNNYWNSHWCPQGHRPNNINI